MEKRALLAIVLSVAVLAVWQIFLAPAPQPARESAPSSQQAQQPPSASGQPANAAAGAQDEASLPAPAEVDERDAGAGPAQVVQADSRQDFRLITRAQDIRLTNEGGQITQWRLTRYTINGGIAVDLIPDKARKAGVLPLQIQVKDDPELTRELASALHVHEITDISAEDPAGIGPGKRVVFTYADAREVTVRKSLEVPEDGYVGRVSFEVRKQGKPLTATLIWASGLAQPSEDSTVSYGHVEGAAVVHDGRDVLRQAAPLLYGAAAGRPIRWAGLESTYFASLVLPREGSEELAVLLHPHPVPAASQGQDPAEAEPLMTAGIQASGGGSYRLFVGPKDYYLLKSLGHELDRVIDFSRFALIYLCTKWLFLALTWINSYIGNYGWSIIILTFLVRLAFFPLTYRSSITMRQTSKKMAKVQPKVKAIQERYRKTKKSMETQRQMNQDIMALYKKEGVNPMGNLGGCLPLLLQMPIFIAFYNLLAVTIEMRQAPFIWWIADLSRADPYSITPLLMGASWILQQWMTSSSIPDPMQRRMMMFMPVIFTFFMMNMPSGLVIYWLTNNVLGMVQQYLTNKKADQLEAAGGQQPRGPSGRHEAPRERGEADSRPRRAEDGHPA